MKTKIPPSRTAALAAMALVSCALGMASLPASAQSITAPLSDPTVDELVRALSGGSAGTHKQVHFRRTQAPDGNHYCPEVSGSAGNISGGTRKNLEVVPYDAGHSFSTDLDVRFAVGSDKLQANDRQLDTLAQALSDPRLMQARFAIAGHTDASGSAKLNLELSCARAISVRTYLVNKGIAGERLSAYGFGSARLLDRSNSESDINRRVELRRDIDFKAN